MDEHIRIHPQCGACGFTFTEDEAVVARKKTPSSILPAIYTDIRPV